MSDTLGSLKSEIREWLFGERLSETIFSTAINDGIESLWETLMKASLDLFMSGPTTVSFAAAAERATIVSVADPTTAPVVGSAVSGALAQHTVHAARTLVTESGTETLPTATGSAVIALNSVAVIPTATFVDGAIGWNCYAGTVAGRLCKQNDEPVAFGSSYQEPDTGVVDNPNAPSPPTANTTGDDIFYIRHLEVLTPNNVYKAFDAGDLDSLMMRRMAGSIAATSAYQNYAWDLINQRQLEIRPAAGLSMVPRYFYIKRPRRLRFDASPLPFLTFPSTAFLRNYALAAIYLGIKEYSSADRYEKKAEMERQRCELAVVEMNRVKNDFISPYLA